ncbi:MAG: tol-pal system protein YbgF, partial [Proteobacteria bacterium]|nr:tol-pal system protein YbgF [Pseudomonadota bacterium]
FLKQYPSHQYSDNAVFWMGESYYQLKNYEQAHAEFEKVVAKYPNGNKVPDALLRSGICMIKLSKPEKAKSSFDQLIKKYPESVAAKKAKATLGEM